MELDVEPTVEVINSIAKRFRDYANNLDRIAQKMRDRKDLEYASEAMQEVKNCFANLRTDLLVTRPMREYEKALRDMEKRNTELIGKVLTLESEDFDKNG